MCHVKFEKEWENLAHNIKYLRTRARLSQKQMSMLLGISTYSLRKIEALEFPPRLSVEILFLIYDHFHIPPYRLLARLLDEDETIP